MLAPVVAEVHIKLDRRNNGRDSVNTAPRQNPNALSSYEGGTLPRHSLVLLVVTGCPTFVAGASATIAVISGAECARVTHFHSLTG